MSTEISIDIEEFKERIDLLRETINGVDSQLSTGETFEFTNVKPLTEDLENLITTIELLERYKSLFNEDIDTLENMGNSIRDQDKTLAQSSEQAIHDPRGYTPRAT